MFSTLAIAALLSIQLVSVNTDPVERCLNGIHHKMFPTPERSDFATCFPWKSKSCCSAELTVNLKERRLKDISHLDLDYCGGLSEQCRTQTINHECLFFCDPNMAKWEAPSGGFVNRVPLCSDACDAWFEACKNDKTYSENWLDEYVLYRKSKGEIKPGRHCRTFTEIFKDAEGFCNHVYGPSYKYERSSNCMVFDFKGNKNPNDKVVH